MWFPEIDTILRSSLLMNGCNLRKLRGGTIFFFSIAIAICLDNELHNYKGWLCSKRHLLEIPQSIDFNKNIRNFLYKDMRKI